ncbi:inorganic pyrophosphatase [Saccharicrinis aurantiacus]|uniref:inorganic pyrophosphatase n=1 Tax=Saccharicrinis aurantiacus TaxID=1849719 RepID=UPI0024906220|nr:inorganic pyrophosphatase [Saccharicrinis aurantiacus]
MSDIMDPIGQLMGLRYKSHPWHGIDVGDIENNLITCFIEVVPTDTIKYEVDKPSGYLKIDRPQKYSNVVPAPYGFIPQTYCGKKVGEYCSQMTGKEEIFGDQDPLDILMLTEKEIPHGDIIAQVIPIGGFRMIDGDEADDKIVSVLKEDVMYGNVKDISELPDLVITRLKHYFLTYKDMPGHNSDCEITHVYGAEEAQKVIQLSRLDYKGKFERLCVELQNY